MLAGILNKHFIDVDVVEGRGGVLVQINLQNYCWIKINKNDLRNDSIGSANNPYHLLTE